MVNTVSTQRQQKVNSLRSGSLTTPPQSAASASNPRYGGHGAAGLSGSQSKNLGVDSSSANNVFNDGSYDEDNIVRYGHTIRLYSKSQYVQESGKRGGYVGYYCKSRNNRLGSNRRNGPYVAIPPFDSTKQHLFMPSTFQVIDPRSLKKDGDELLYGEEVMLVDDQGMVWNNCMGPISYLGPKPRGSNGQMNLRFVQEANPYGVDKLLDDCIDKDRRKSSSSSHYHSVRYGDLDVKLDVVNVNRRLLKKKYTNFITNFKKDVSKLLGGYLVCDGRGYPASFCIHHAPPQVEQLTIFRPLPSSASPPPPPSSSLSSSSSSSSRRNSNVNNNMSTSDQGGTKLVLPVGSPQQLGVHHAVQAHYAVPWNTGVFLDLLAYSAPSGLETPQGRVLRSISSVLPPRSPASSSSSTSTSSSSTTASSSSSSNSMENKQVPPYRDPLCRVVLSNGGRATLWRDQILDPILNPKSTSADGFWIDLLDIKDEEDEISLRVQKDYLQLKEKKQLLLLKKQQQAVVKTISGLNIELDENDSKLRKGSLHVACCLLDDSDVEEDDLQEEDDDNMVNNDDQGDNDGHNPSSTTQEKTKKNKKKINTSVHHPEGVVGLLKDITALGFPWLLRVWFLLACSRFLYLAAQHFLVPNTRPSSFIVDFDTFTANLSALRRLLVTTMKKDSLLSSIFKPIQILALFLKTISSKIMSILSTNDAISVLSPSFFSLIGASYIANYFGISILEPLLYSDSLNYQNEDNEMMEFPPRRIYLHNNSTDNFMTARNTIHLFNKNEKLERWELTLIGWDFEKASVLNQRRGGGGKNEELDGEIDPNTSMPYMPERFLLAEAGDYSKALERWRDTLAWRRVKEADMVLERPHPNYATTKECYPHFFHQRDKVGNVVYYELPGMIDWPRIKATGLKDQFVDHVMYVQEYMWTVLQPSQDDRVTLVLDLNGLSMATVFNKEIVTIIKNIVAMTSTHYPQRSHKMIVINVPGWFGMLFNLIKPLLNEAQKAKICIFRSHEVLEGLRATIDNECIPKEYGGNSPYKLGQSPDEVALCKQVFDNLKKHNTRLYVDEPLKNPDGARATIEEWIFSPRTFA